MGALAFDILFRGHLSAKTLASFSSCAGWSQNCDKPSGHAVKFGEHQRHFGVTMSPCDGCRDILKCGVACAIKNVMSGYEMNHPG